MSASSYLCLILLFSLVLLFHLFVFQVVCVEAQASDLSPSVSATCSQGFMRVSNIYWALGIGMVMVIVIISNVDNLPNQVKLRTGQPFHGVIHARDSRDNACLT